MLDAAKDACSFASGRSQADLYPDKQLRLALLKSIEIIGEAASRVGEETRAKHPSLPWQDMIGIRNRLVHGYFDVDLSLLWNTVVSDLPVLIGDLEIILGRKP
jgi:uncharacterized protein with HEPN domain